MSPSIIMSVDIRAQLAILFLVPLPRLALLLDSGLLVEIPIVWVSTY